jgi:hypothetical protein
VWPNLGAALRRLRFAEGGTVPILRDAFKSGKLRNKSGKRRMWIDALCINQADLHERSQQVSFMKEIHDRAGDVIVWLGEDLGYALKAISLIQKVAEIAHKEDEYTYPRRSLIPHETIKPRDDLPQPIILIGNV